MYCNNPIVGSCGWPVTHLHWKSFIQARKNESGCKSDASYDSLRRTAAFFAIWVRETATLGDGATATGGCGDVCHGNTDPPSHWEYGCGGGRVSQSKQGKFVAVKHLYSGAVGWHRGCPQLYLKLGAQSFAAEALMKCSSVMYLRLQAGDEPFFAWIYAVKALIICLEIGECEPWEHGCVTALLMSAVRRFC